MARPTHCNRGTDNYAHKLNDEIVRRIRADFARRKELLKELRAISDHSLAVKYGVSSTVIWRVCARKIWGHVE